MSGIKGKSGIYLRTPSNSKTSKGLHWHHSTKSKLKISLSRRGKKLSKEQKEKIRIAMTGKKRSPETCKRMSESHKGEKSYLWRGGITPLNHNIRNSLEYKLWRKSVFERDNWTCIWCKIRGKKLNADHIKPFAYYPELRFAIDNGRTLCETCHKTTDTWGRPKKLKISEILKQ